MGHACMNGDIILDEEGTVDIGTVKECMYSLWVRQIFIINLTLVMSLNEFYFW